MKGVTASARGLVRVTWQDVEVSLGPGGGADQHGYSGYLLMLDEAQVIRDHREREGQHPLSLLIAAVNSLRLAGADERKAVDRCGRPTRTVRGSVRRSVCQRSGAGHRELQFNRAGVHIYEKVVVELTVIPVDRYPAPEPFNKEFRL
jgi:hypothetical protein